MRPHQDADDVVPVPNHVPWYYITLAILVGSALFVNGIRMVASRWERELGAPRWFDVAAEAFGIVAATALGCLTGYIIWEWVLGGVVALVGAVSSSLVVAVVKARVDAGREAAQSVLDEAKR